MRDRPTPPPRTARVVLARVVLTRVALTWVALTWVALTCVALLAGCGHGDERTADAQADAQADARADAIDDPTVVAVYDVAAHDGDRSSLETITFDDLDAAILALPPDQRNSFGAGDLERYGRLARALAVDETLRAEAVASGFAASEDHLAELDTMRRQVLVQQWLLTSPPEIEQPTEADLRARYELSAERLGEPEKRFALSIFRRLAPGQDPAPVVAELEALRRRVLDGESFAVLAAEHSESEARHMKGAIGWVVRGQIAPDLEALLFGLEESTPSEPVVTRDGVHLFYIDTVLDGEIPPFEAVEDTIRQTLLDERRARALEDLVVTTELADDAFVPERDTLDELLAHDDPDTLLLRVGTFELTLGDLRRQVDAEQRRVDGEAPPSSELARALFHGIRRREVLHHRVRADGEELTPDIARRFERQADRFLVQRYSEHLVDQEIDRRDDALRAFHADHRNRFVTLLELKLQALVVPHGDAPSRVMATLEQRRDDLIEGETTLEALARELGGEVQTSDWVDINRLATFRAKAAFFAPSLAEGEVSPPYNSGRAIEIFRVLERREPRPLDFDEARERVRRAYREQHGQQIYEALVAERLEAAGFRVLDDHLEALVGARPAPTATAPTATAPTATIPTETITPQE